MGPEKQRGGVADTSVGHTACSRCISICRAQGILGRGCPALCSLPVRLLGTQCMAHFLSFATGVKSLVSQMYLRTAEACPRLSKIHRYFSVIRMQPRAEISNTPEVFFYSLNFLIKESLRYMISIHTGCSTLTKPTSLLRYLATCVHVIQSGTGGK